MNQGRQPKKWIENIKEDVDIREIRFKEAKTRPRGEV